MAQENEHINPELFNQAIFYVAGRLEKKGIAVAPRFLIGNTYYHVQIVGAEKALTPNEDPFFNPLFPLMGRFNSILTGENKETSYTKYPPYLGLSSNTETDELGAMTLPQIPETTLDSADPNQAGRSSRWRTVRSVASAMPLLSRVLS